MLHNASSRKAALSDELKADMLPPNCQASTTDTLPPISERTGNSDSTGDDSDSASGQEDSEPRKAAPLKDRIEAKITYISAKERALEEALGQGQAPDVNIIQDIEAATLELQQLRELQVMELVREDSKPQIAATIAGALEHSDSLACGFDDGAH